MTEKELRKLNRKQLFELLLRQTERTEHLQKKLNEAEEKIKDYYGIIWRRQWHLTPVLLPGKSHGWRSLVGCRLWGHTESDTSEAT